MTDTTLPVYTVLADPNTGEWIDGPTWTTETSTRQQWAAMRDTHAVHYDTAECEVFDNKTGKVIGTETRLVRVEWLS